MKKNSSIKPCILFLSAVISVFITPTAFANDRSHAPASNSWENASTEALKDAISQTTLEIQDHARKASEMKETIEFAWNNPDFTSDAIAAKRQTLREAEAAFIQARIALQEEMYCLPEIQQLADENKTLLNTIDTLRSKHTALIKLLKMRHKAPPLND